MATKTSSSDTARAGELVALLSTSLFFLFFSSLSDVFLGDFSVVQSSLRHSLWVKDSSPR